MKKARGARDIAMVNRMECSLFHYEPEQSCKGMGKEFKRFIRVYGLLKLQRGWIELKGLTKPKSHTDNFNLNQIFEESHIIKKESIVMQIERFLFFYSTSICPFSSCWHFACINIVNPFTRFCRKQVSCAVNKCFIVDCCRSEKWNDERSSHK